MSTIHDESSPCRRIAELLNDLVDGDEAPQERLAEARQLVEKNPQCRALYQTLMKTVELYRMRRNEIKDDIPIVIPWDTLTPDSDTEDDNITL